MEKITETSGALIQAAYTRARQYQRRENALERPYIDGHALNRDVHIVNRAGLVHAKISPLSARETWRKS